MTIAGLSTARPGVRVVLHAGPVVAGECGGAKLAIVYLGDILNTAARIEETAKAIGRDCLISDALLAQIDLPPSLGVEPLGSIQLRGRQQRSLSTRSSRLPSRSKHRPTDRPNLSLPRSCRGANKAGQASAGGGYHSRTAGVKQIKNVAARLSDRPLGPVPWLVIFATCAASRKPPHIDARLLQHGRRRTPGCSTSSGSSAAAAAAITTATP
jgi:hypothetical protein